jgi:predicted nuclease with TOPRIM domain
VTKIGNLEQLQEDIKNGVSGKQNLVFTFLPSEENYKQNFEESEKEGNFDAKYDFYDENRRLDVKKGLDNFHRISGHKDDLGENSENLNQELYDMNTQFYLLSDYEKAKEAFGLTDWRKFPPPSKHFQPKFEKFHQTFHPKSPENSIFNSFP